MIDELEKEYESCRMSGNVSLYILIASVASLLAFKIFDHGDLIQAFLFTATVGGSLVFYIINRQQASQILAKMDTYTYSRYGKRYNDSRSDILRDRYQKQSS